MRNIGELVFINYDGIEFNEGDRIKWTKTDYKGYETGEIVEGILSWDDYSFKYVINTDDFRSIRGFDRSCKFELIEKNNRSLIHNNFVKRNYIIGARTEQQLNALEQLFLQFQSLGNLGCSKEVSVYIDGDGQMQLHFLRDGEKLKETDDVGYANIDFENNMFDLG